MRPRRRPTASPGGPAIVRGMQPGDTGPPRRLLDRAPGERFVVADPSPAAGGHQTGRSAARRGALRAGLAVAAAGATIHVLLAVGGSVQVGLLVVTPLLGWAVGFAVRLGGRGRLASDGRVGLAMVIASGMLVGALAVNWLLSGAYLGPIDYLVSVYGVLIPGQLLFVGAGAFIGAR